MQGTFFMLDGTHAKLDVVGDDSMAKKGAVAYSLDRAGKRSS
ncbi:hypothetical protein [Compostibacillus humi]|nr:hypothetical protein [Compostibacillus humi]